MTSRIITDILLIVAAIVLPWWLFVVVLILGVFTFEYYLEGLIAGFMIDVLYGPYIVLGVTVPFFTLGAATCLLIALPLKDRLSFYETRR